MTTLLSDTDYVLVVTDGPHAGRYLGLGSTWASPQYADRDGAVVGRRGGYGYRAGFLSTS